MFPQPIKAFAWKGSIPQFQRIRLEFDRAHIQDVAAAVSRELDQVENLGLQLSGKSVAITAGSRGIDRIDQILAALVNRLRLWGAQPFIVPAMGSHGGATAEGQLGLLAEFGITEARVGAPIHSSMETVELGRLPNGMPVYMDQHAASADAIIVVNRIKPHTDFSGEFESGLAKMAAIGLGKLHGADTLHRFGVPGLRDYVPEAARLVCQKAPVIFGLATVENAYHQAAHIALVPPEGIAGTQERELLELAYRLMPRFPFPEIDVLVVDEIGKNISGVGMDPKVIGRVKVHGIADMTVCDIRAIAVLRLTAESHGNATGVGLADVTTRRLVSQVDFETTYLNCITSGILGIQRAAIPVVAPSDKAAIETALRVCGRPDVLNARAARIRNTLSMGEMDVTPALLAEALPGSAITPVGEVFSLPFDELGNLPGF